MGKRNLEQRMIESLMNNEVFVFGSNLQGRHGRGAAKDALKFGAVQGKGRGHYGKTYAIPTVSWEPSYHFIGWDEVSKEMAVFFGYARQNSHLTFLLTPVGTGLAGGKIEDLDAMIDKMEVPSNVKLIWREGDLS